MRPPRLVLLLLCFIALPIFLTFLSLVTAHPGQADVLNAGYNSHSSRLRAFFSFHTPSSLFPPSAVISLTNDNSTFFLARPANFGGALPNDGLSGRLWVGRGFAGGPASDSEGELGCSDVPGWDEGDQKRSDEQRATTKSPRKEETKNKHTPAPAAESDNGSQNLPDTNSLPSTDTTVSGDEADAVPSEDDGTDDHLHHPLSESNPAEAVEPGQPAGHEAISDKKKPTHADIQSLQESAEIAGKIVLLSRGGCGFLEKVKWAQRRGGIALVVGDDEPGKPLITMYARGDISNVTIPAIFTSYTTAHLLSSLVPQELLEEQAQDNSKGQEEIRTTGKKNKEKGKPKGPTFTSSKGMATSTAMLQPSIFPATDSRSRLSGGRGGRRGWLSALFSALGAGSENGYPWHIGEDSRRPPSSGHIDWVLLEDWDEEEPTYTSTKSSTPGTATSTVAKIPQTKSRSSAAHQSTSDEFVIGVQDWRDPDLVVSDAKASSKPGLQKGQVPKVAGSSSSINPAATGAFNGGSITPGSGEYGNSRVDLGRGSGLENSKSPSPYAESKGPLQITDNNGWFGPSKWRTTNNNDLADHKDVEHQDHLLDLNANTEAEKKTEGQEEAEEHEGLWVTLTPTTVSTSPFFDTLLVLVVSPLVTLTVVYALLLLRSRIRRRRWRAPKSVVERLPVRIYHTMSNSSSTTSSQVASPNASSPTSPLLVSTTQTVTSRSRPRSHTTSDVGSNTVSNPEFSSASSSPAKEKPTTAPGPRKRYTGRQLECVVCLEDYVDGQSLVMSLPCGHEFHADCITPWLVTRRRTCPICKGDVVRSMAHADQQNDQRQEGEDRSDDVQDRVAETVNESPSAAIPIPPRIDDSDDDSDIERGAEATEPLVSGSQPAPRSAWRNLVSGNLSALSGETVWRQTPADRNR